MAIKRALATIFTYFQTGAVPTQQQYEDSFFSMRHKDDTIPIGDVLNLQTEINKITDSDAFRNDIGNRNISVNVRTRENGMFRDIPFEDVVMADTSTYPFTFDLTITQRFEATDPMAVSVRSAN